MTEQLGHPSITPQSFWLIIGCSTSFGDQLARQLLAHGSLVVATARDLADLSDIVRHEKAGCARPARLPGETAPAAMLQRNYGR